jgi:cyclophilin family peptidyl-prolyl cis-trans isomerase
MRILIFLLGLCLFSSSLLANENPIVQIETSRGDIIIELFPEEAPKAVKNFVRYIEDGFYTNTLIHRVIDGFIIQGGGFSSGMVPKKMRKPIKNESKGNALKNIRGTVGLAQNTDANSAASQFYINVTDNPHLDYNPRTQRPGFTVFGNVIKGMNVVDKIRKVRTHTVDIYSEFYKRDIPIKDVPEKEILIKKVTLLRG